MREVSFGVTLFLPFLISGSINRCSDASDQRFATGLQMTDTFLFLIFSLIKRRTQQWDKTRSAGSTAKIVRRAFFFFF
jgi:hypothetical protein